MNNLIETNKNYNINDNIQLSPEGEVNSGGYIYIFTALHQPWGLPFFSPFVKQWISKDIPSYGSQSKRAKIAIHWFGKY